MSALTLLWIRMQHTFLPVLTDLCSAAQNDSQVNKLSTLIQSVVSSFQSISTEQKLRSTP